MSYTLHTQYSSQRVIFRPVYEGASLEDKGKKKQADLIIILPPGLPKGTAVYVNVWYERDGNLVCKSNLVKGLHRHINLKAWLSKGDPQDYERVKRELFGFDIRKTYQEKFELVEALSRDFMTNAFRAKITDADLAAKWKAEDVLVKIPLSLQTERPLIEELLLKGRLYTELLQSCGKHLEQVYGVEIFKGSIAVVSEYVSGGSLKNLMDSAKGRDMIPAEKALSITEGVLQGLKTIHEAKMIHRNLTPANILIEGNHSKVSLSLTGCLYNHEYMMHSSCVNTEMLFRMSPELIRGLKVSFNSDLWSLGTVLYEMLYGRLPFGISPHMPIMAAVNKIISDELEFPEDPEVPVGLREIISRALNRDPAQRYQSAEEMHEDIRNLAPAAGDGGFELTVLCPQCRHSIPLTAKTCPHCGKKVF